MKKTDTKNRQKSGHRGRKHHVIQKGNYRVEGRLNQPKQKGASGSIQTKDGVHTSNTKTRHRKNAITRMPSLWGVAHNRTHTMGVYANYEKEKRTWHHERGMDRWNRRTEKIDRIYKENRIIPWNMNKDYV
jgi:hypothetical protein